MIERTDAITNEVLEPFIFVLAYPTVSISPDPSPTPQYFVACTIKTLLGIAYFFFNILSESVRVLGSIVE